MALRRVRGSTIEPQPPVIPPEIKKVVKKLPVKKKEVKELVNETPKEKEKEEVPILKDEKVVPEIKKAEITKTKKEWDGIGLIGINPDLNIFKGIVKSKGGVVGEELLKLIKEYNLKNK